MPFLGMDAETDEGLWKFWRYDPDNKKPVRFRLRRIDAEWDRETRKRIAKSISGRNAGKLSGADVVECQVRLTRDRAAYALLDSENFSMLISGPKAQQYFTEQLKPETAFKVGDVVSLDGRWSPEVKNKLLEVLPELAAWASDTADEMKHLEAEEEEEAAGSFR